MVQLLKINLYFNGYCVLENHHRPPTEYPFTPYTKATPLAQSLRQRLLTLTLRESLSDLFQYHSKKHIKYTNEMDKLKEKKQDEDIQVSQTKIKLTCPYTLRRLNTPVRMRSCRHLIPFGLEAGFFI
jgi:hypothetical protein